MIAEAFGFSGWPPIRPHRVWIEEYEEGRSAINLVEMEPSNGSDRNHVAE
jgi:hypothetical protein